MEKESKIKTNAIYILLETAAVWSSSLTLENISDLERVQKSAVRIIIGKPYESYTETLKELGIKRLS